MIFDVLAKVIRLLASLATIVFLVIAVAFLARVGWQWAGGMFR